MMMRVLERAATNQVGEGLRNDGQGPRYLCLTSQDHQPVGCLYAAEKNTPQQALCTGAAVQKVSLEVKGVLSP